MRLPSWLRPRRREADTSSFLSWDELGESEFFSWFGISEVGRQPADGGRVVVRCKPGGFQEAVDLEFDLDAAPRVRGARLLLDRSWVDAAATAPFAADIGKSFLAALAPNSAQARALSDEIQNLIAQNPNVLRRADPSAPPRLLVPPGLVPAIDAFSGRGQEARVSDGPTTIAIKNVEQGARRVLRIAVSHAA